VTTTTRRVRVLIRGRVQGVFFRAETRARAESLGVAGSVRNMPDGNVEAVFEGEPERVGSLVEWCRRGPDGAAVENVDVTDEEPTGEPGFAVR
jgi:acylphosphatase